MMLAGDVVAIEKHPGRARELEENVRRLGATNVSVVCADGLALPPELSGFDRALVDAPCSGLGILASRPDARWRAEPLPDLQLALLQAAAERVKAGGTITYSVCAINAAENEDVVAASGLEPDPLGTEWPAFRHPRRPEFLLTLPHVHRTSGFFIARLQGSLRFVRHATSASFCCPDFEGWKKSRDETSACPNLILNAAPPSWAQRTYSAQTSPRVRLKLASRVRTSDRRARSAGAVDCARVSSASHKCRKRHAVRARSRSLSICQSPYRSGMLMTSIRASGRRVANTRNADSKSERNRAVEVIAATSPWQMSFAPMRISTRSAP